MEGERRYRRSEEGYRKGMGRERKGRRERCGLVQCWFVAASIIHRSSAESNKYGNESDGENRERKGQGGERRG